MGEPDKSPEAIAHGLVRRIFELLHECRATLPEMGAPRARPDLAPAYAERLLYLALLGAIEAGLVRTMEDAVTVLRPASQPRAAGRSTARRGGNAAALPRDAGHRPDADDSSWGPVSAGM